MKEVESNGVAESELLLDKQEKTTNLPVAAIIVACMIILCEVISSNSIYPYVNFMMQWLDIPHEKQGYYVGFLASSYFFAQFIGSFIWAYISRRICRRNTLILGMTGVALTSFMFGISRTYYLAIISRFLCGLFSGNIGMAKTILAENANSSNQARLFSFVGITWGVGNILGPFLGGVLSQPCTQYKIDEHSLVCYFPFLLPNYANCILITIAILIVVVAIPPPPPTQLLSDEHSTINDTNHDSKKLFKKRAIWIACSIYALVSLTWSVFEEVFPLWSFTNGFSARQLGLLQSFGGVVGIMFQLTSYPWLVGKLGMLMALRVGALSAILSFSSVSWVSTLFNIGVAKEIWVLGSVYIFVQFGAEILFVTSMTVVANSTNKKNLDVVNCMAQGLASAVRSVGPASGASLFAWSISNSLTPLGDHLVFMVVVGLVVIICVLSFFQKLKPRD